MYKVDDKYYSKQDALKRCQNLINTSQVFFSDGSFVNDKKNGGYGFISIGKKEISINGTDTANSPVEMELKAIKHTLIYLNMNKKEFTDINIVIFNDCLNAISKIKKYIDNPNKPNSLLDEIYILLNSLNDKNLFICWIKKESLKYHEKVDSLSKSARDLIK